LPPCTSMVSVFTTMNYGLLYWFNRHSDKEGISGYRCDCHYYGYIPPQYSPTSHSVATVTIKLCRQWRDTRKNIHYNFLEPSMGHTCIPRLYCRNQYSCRRTTCEYHFHCPFQVQSLKDWKDLAMFLCMESVTSRHLLTIFLPCRRDRWEFISENNGP